MEERSHDLFRLHPLEINDFLNRLLQIEIYIRLINHVFGVINIIKFQFVLVFNLINSLDFLTNDVFRKINVSVLSLVILINILILPLISIKDFSCNFIFLVMKVIEFIQSHVFILFVREDRQINADVSESQFDTAFVCIAYLLVSLGKELVDIDLGLTNNKF